MGNAEAIPSKDGDIMDGYNGDKMNILQLLLPASPHRQFDMYELWGYEDEEKIVIKFWLI